MKHPLLKLYISLPDAADGTVQCLLMPLFVKCNQLTSSGGSMYTYGHMPCMNNGFVLRVLQYGACLCVCVQAWCIP